MLAKSYILFGSIDIAMSTVQSKYYFILRYVDGTWGCFNTPKILST